MNVNKEQSKQIMDYFKWKLNTSSLEINEINLARYLNISPTNSSDILQTLYQEEIVKLCVTSRCPVCSKSYRLTTQELDQNIFCTDCHTDFRPNANKRLLMYSYIINEDNRYLKSLSSKTVQKLRPFKLVEQKDNFNMNDNKLSVFLSYSHKDETFKNELDIHLAPLKRNNKIKTWNDRELTAGSKFDDEIKKHLNESQIIILLISADFISSDYCYEIEMGKALERMERNDAIVIPIILRPCLWTDTPLKDIQALPKDGKAISTYDNKDNAYLEIVQGIKKAIERY